jgi:CO/xanthine dehydrogenase Mo-binding subunit
VQLIWTREDDTRTTSTARRRWRAFTASLDAAGNVLAWDNKSASGAIGTSTSRATSACPAWGPDKTTAEGEYDMQYEIANQRIAHVIVDSAVPIGYWRSVGHSHNAFFKEGFIDELAHAAGKDSVEFRRALLKRHPRHLAVLDAAVAAAGSAPDGRAHGVAVHQSFGSIVAQVAEVSVEGTEIRVHRVVCAVDCGIVVNPNIIAQQVESAVVFGLSAALAARSRSRTGGQQRNFGDYPVLRMNQAPDGGDHHHAERRAARGHGRAGRAAGGAGGGGGGVQADGQRFAQFAAAGIRRWRIPGIRVKGAVARHCRQPCRPIPAARRRAFRQRRSRRFPPSARDALRQSRKHVSTRPRNRRPA